jgi:hypothetical protein
MLNRIVLCIALLVSVCPRPALCQATPAPSPSSTRQPESTQYYKLSFTLRELDEGKLVNQRAFLMRICTDGSWNSLRAGTRLPVSTGNNNINYIDVGVNLDVRAMEGTDTAVPIYVKAEISSVGSENVASSPAIRQIQVRTESLLSLGKATIVFSGDDPSSKRRFELEVTPTRDR